MCNNNEKESLNTELLHAPHLRNPRVWGQVEASKPTLFFTYVRKTFLTNVRNKVGIIPLAKMHAPVHQISLEEKERGERKKKKERKRLLI